MQHLNTFQKWGLEALARHGIAARASGNWIRLEATDEAVMTYSAVTSAIVDAQHREAAK